MIAGNDKLEDKGAASVSGAASRSCLADVLLITRDREWAASTEKMLAENLYGASIALNGDQIVERLKGAWYHFALIDLDSIDVAADYLVAKFRQIEPDIPIIGLSNHAGISCPDVICLKKPLTVEQIKDIFPVAATTKEVKTGRRALKGLVLAAAIGIFLWVLLIWLWG